MNRRNKGWILKGRKNSKPINHDQIFLENIILNVPHFIFWKDINSVYLGCNENYSKLLGLNSPAEIVGKTDFELGWQSDGHTADFFKQKDQEVLQGKVISNLEQTLSPLHHKKIIVSLNKVPLLDQHGNIIGILGVSTDITQQKKKEKELLLAKEQAELANRAKSEFIANISHDLRTPLNGILGIAQLLQTKKHLPEQEKLIKDLNISGNLLLNLIDNILNFTKIEAGKFEPKLSTFNLKKLCKDIVTSLLFQAKEKNLMLKFYYKPITDWVMCEPNFIRRILLNLLVNAIKFTENGFVSLIIDHRNDENQKAMMKIVVEDTGIGIPPEKINSIFDRFNIIVPSYSGGYQGLGLGLTITKKFTEELGGTIHTSSKVGKGSKFTVEIPATFTKTFSQKKQPENLKLSFKKLNLSVLLIEDEKISQSVEKSLLEELGCQVDAANNANEAMLYIKNNNYDAIFLDIGLPDKNGYLLAQEIRQFNEKTKLLPIIALTAHVLDNEKNKCFKVGMNGIIKKPVTNEEIKIALLNCLPGSKL